MWGLMQASCEYLANSKLLSFEKSKFYRGYADVIYGYNERVIFKELIYEKKILENIKK